MLDLHKRLMLWQVACCVLLMLFILSILTKGFIGCPVSENDMQAGTDEKLRLALSSIERVEIRIGASPEKGNMSASVTIVEFSDFQCPACQSFFDSSYKRLMQDYVSTGKVRYVFRDFPLEMHNNAIIAAEAAQCANDQGIFWEMHDLLFQNQDKLDLGSLKKYATQLGLGIEEFNSCLDSRKYVSKIQASLQEGIDYGVQGTPSLFVNGIMLTGPSYASLRQIIDFELKEAR